MHLYNQLRFYAYLFDSDKILKEARGTNKHGERRCGLGLLLGLSNDLDELLALTNLNAVFLNAMKEAADKYLNKCGRRWVDLGAIFSFMKV